MIDIATARQMALTLSGTDEKEHFGMPSFRANNKIFSTFRVKEQLVMVKLSPIDQSVFNAFNPDIFYPVPNKWGLQGCTLIDLTKVRKDMLQDALTLAWELANAKKGTKK